MGFGDTAVEATITIAGSEASELASIQVYDTLGRQVVNVTSAEHMSSLDVASLPAGLYIVHATLVDGRTTSSRFTVTR